MCVFPTVHFIGELDAWLNDEEYRPVTNNYKRQVDSAWQMSGKVSEELNDEFKNIIKASDARERARKASREIIKERNDTSGGGKVSKFVIMIHLLH